MSIVKKDIKSILIFSHGELIGDGMMKIPFLKAVRNAFPKAKISWLAGRHPTIFNSALKQITAPYIDKIYDHTTLGDKWMDCFISRWKDVLEDDHYDIILDTEHKIPPTLMLKRIPHKVFISASHKWFFSNIKPKAGYKRPLLLRDRLIDMVEFAINEKPKFDFTIDIPLKWQLAAKELVKDYLGIKPIVLLAPGAGGRFKCWPLENFVKLANRLIAVGAQPMFILGPAEPEWQPLIKQHLPNAIFPLQMATEMSAYLTIALGQLATVNVANDGGVGHILASSNQPTISMWGPTDPLKSTPNGEKVTVVTAQQFGGNAMKDIPIDGIYKIVNTFLQHQLQGLYDLKLSQTADVQV